MGLEWGGIHCSRKDYRIERNPPASGGLMQISCRSELCKMDAQVQRWNPSVAVLPGGG